MSFASTLLAELRAAATSPPLPRPSASSYRAFAQTGDRLGYERQYFARRRRLVALALTGAPGLAEALEDVCDEDTWALPAHEYVATAVGRGMDQCVDLFAAETAHTLAEAVSTLDLPDPVHDRVREQVEHRVLRPYFDDPRPQLWESWTNNWSAVCAGAAGMAALALVDDPARLDRMLDRVRAAMRTFLSGFGPDGGCAEGVEYWVYGFGYFTYFAAALRERTGVDLLDNPLVRQIAAFPYRVALGGGAYVPFSDSVERPMLPTGLLSHLASRLDVPVPSVGQVPPLDADTCYRWGHLSRTLQWTNPAALNRPPRPARSVLPDLGWVVDRRPRVAFAAKGGHNDEPHNHNDLGQFVLAVDGELLLTDLGAGEYTKDYFGDARYTALHTSAEGHSVPLLDGHSQLAGRSRSARVLSRTPFALDLTAAYDVPGLRALRRTFQWSSEAELALTDELAVDEPTRIDEVFISRHRPSLTGDGARWTGTTGSVTLTAPGWAWAVEELPTKDHHGRPDMVFRTRLHRVAGAGASTYRFSFFVPT